MITIKKLQHYLFILFIFFFCSQSFATCLAEIDDIDFGNFKLVETPNNSINTLLYFTCDNPTELNSTMTLFFSKNTIENGSNSLIFNININGTSIAANEDYQFTIPVINTRFSIPVTFNISNLTNSISSQPGEYTSSIILQYSY